MQIRVIQWDFDAWEDYLYWQRQNKKMLKRINQLVKDICRNPFEGQELFNNHRAFRQPHSAVKGWIIHIQDAIISPYSFLTVLGDIVYCK
mgnify:CR=1 FL=1